MICDKKVLLIVILTLVFCETHVGIKNLNEHNWDLILEGEWMIEFYAPWCPACKALQPTWEQFSSYSDQFDIAVGQVDVTQSPGLSGRFMVTALPTIFHVVEGDFRQYRGSRDIDAFLAFIKERKWKEIEPLPSWKSPSSFQMSAVAHFFKLSQLLRNLHARLMEEYGLPTWGSYLIFAIATIFVGALLGLVIVFCIDFVYPPKLIGFDDGRPPLHQASKDSGDDDEEVEDEIVDDENTASPPTRKRRAARKAD